MNHRTVSFRGKRVKIFAAALLLLTVTTCSLGLAESGWMFNTLANVYESHDLASMVIAEAQPGQIYTILDSTERNRWIKVSYIDTQFGNQVVGWIKEDILETPPSYYEEPSHQSYEHQGDSRANSSTLSNPTNPNTSSGVPNSLGLGYVLCESLSVRMEPNVTSKVIANFLYDTTFSITEVIDTWYKVSSVRHGKSYAYCQREGKCTSIMLLFRKCSINPWSQTAHSFCR